MADDSARSAAWGVVSVVFGGGAVATWIVAVTPQAAFVPLAAVASVLSLITVIGIYMTFANVYDWKLIKIVFVPVKPTVTKAEKEDRPADHPVDAGQDARRDSREPAFLTASPLGRLDVKLEDEDWEQWQGLVWIAALKFKITNRTDRIIRLASFGLDNALNLQRLKRELSSDAYLSLSEAVAMQSATYRPALALENVQPHDTISGWYVTCVSVRKGPSWLNPRNRRPVCVFQVNYSGGYLRQIIPARRQIIPARRLRRLAGS
jgi:hypothetical protein